MEVEVKLDFRVDSYIFTQFSLAIDINHSTKVNIRLEKYNLDREKRKKGRVVLNSHYVQYKNPISQLAFL